MRQNAKDETLKPNRVVMFTSTAIEILCLNIESLTVINSIGKWSKCTSNPLTIVTQLGEDQSRNMCG